MQNLEVQLQLSQTGTQFSPQSFEDEMLQEYLEIEVQKQGFSMLFEELLVCSNIPQEEPQRHKNLSRNTKINQFRRRSHKVVKKQQERKRNQKSTQTFLQEKKQRVFNEFKLKEFQAQGNTQETQGEQGEWQGDHQSHVQEHHAIPLSLLREDQNLVLLNLCNDNFNINDNCIEQNNYEINSNKFEMNAYLIPKALAPKIPKL
ncbi:unnamed protein product (macronuclear) [Paramecium tetraurelia]|uniref:BZIP domain-containing protein n=1 Tax=Paramecium tetraurelia TaxID=5888 RepID=A0BLX6_PARTE|nr:uncharacterized protein GSPATT00030177001 [Paramecium tetraurelia]CAK59543.1 unnamed protein product [Paramecium tetraurelia]|eukprot:XP_001426941.1 hypothetical protein (macronuclear) [Paramecium tetraurelia strain d4-2]